MYRIGQALLLFAGIFFCGSYVCRVHSAEPDSLQTIVEDQPANTEEKGAESAAEKAKDDESSTKESGKGEAKKDSADSDETKQATSESKDEKAAAESKDKPAAKTDEKSAAKAEEKAKRKTLKIEPKRLKLDLTLDGVFVPSEMKEVWLRPEAWTTYEIVEVVEHGAKVRKGETLIKFDSEKIDEAIADLELEQRLNELAILRAEEELPRTERTLKLDEEEAVRANQQAKEDYERYKEIDRPMSVKSAEFMVKYYDFMVGYEKDELEQLEKMYEADDLTDDTEEIILKRQKTSLEFAEFNLESAKLSRDRTLQIRLPRTDISIKESLERAEMAKARAQLAAKLNLNQARYELEQRKKARVKSLDRHAKLLADKALMEIKAPADGVVFYGQNVNGRWADTQSLINKFKPKQNATPGAVLMTIVEPRPLFVTSTLDEGKRPDVADGKKAKVALPAEGAERIPGEVKSISSIPVSTGKFQIDFSLEQSAIPDWVAPGMSCKVHLVTFDKKDALLVPKTAVHDDEDDDEKKYVWLITDPDEDDAKPERRDVKVGKSKSDDVQITKGLKAGDVISLDDESKKKEADKDEAKSDEKKTKEE